MKGEPMGKRQTGDEAEDQVTVEGSALAVIEEPREAPHAKRRRIERLEELPFTEEERLRVEHEIIEANKSMRKVEDMKSAQNKTWNAEINTYRETMDEAIDVLDKGCFKVKVDRIEEHNYSEERVIYYDVDTGEEVDSREMTEEEKQTRMDM